MLLFMPWCPIDKEYTVGDIRILPFDRQHPVAELDGTIKAKINEILESYRNIKGEPIRKAALVQFGDKSAVADLPPEELDSAADFVSWACFSALARRDYFGLQLDYCNSDNFSLLAQRFDLTSDYTCLRTIRRDGRTLSLYRMSDVAITVPVHCHNVSNISLDSAILAGRTVVWEKLTQDERERWQDAIDCFNLASPDNDAIRHHVGWILLCSAFQRLLDANSNAADLARRLEETLVPRETIQSIGTDRFIHNRRSDLRSIRYEWMREFCCIRGIFAHGNLCPPEKAWKPHEHLFLSTLAFPLVVKTQFSNRGCYTFTREDNAQLAFFERFARLPDFDTAPSSDDGQQRTLGASLLDQCREEELQNEFRANLAKAFGLES